MQFLSSALFALAATSFLGMGFLGMGCTEPETYAENCQSDRCDDGNTSAAFAMEIDSIYMEETGEWLGFGDFAAFVSFANTSESSVRNEYPVLRPDLNYLPFPDKTEIRIGESDRNQVWVPASYGSSIHFELQVVDIDQFERETLASLELSVDAESVGELLTVALTSGENDYIRYRVIRRDVQDNTSDDGRRQAANELKAVEFSLRFDNHLSLSGSYEDGQIAEKREKNRLILSYYRSEIVSHGAAGNCQEAALAYNEVLADVLTKTFSAKDQGSAKVSVLPDGFAELFSSAEICSQ